MKIKFFFCFLFGLSVVLLLAGCNKGKSDDAEESKDTTEEEVVVIGEAMRAQAKETFISRCSSCHGTLGKGDGPASKGLTPPPRNFTDATWQSNIDDAYLARIIQYGGGAVGRSVAMPSHPDLGGNKELLAALIQYIRSLKDADTQ